MLLLYTSREIESACYEDLALRRRNLDGLKDLYRCVEACGCSQNLQHFHKAPNRA
jgi:hypothetical protein